MNASKYLSGAYVVDTDGDNPSIERNPPDCPWCFANADDPEECRCNGGESNVTDCPKEFCDQRRSACYQAFEEALFHAIDITTRRSELRTSDEDSQRYYAQACCGNVLEWLDHYSDVRAAQKIELTRRAARR